MPVLNNDDQIAREFLRRFEVWKVLFASEAGILGDDQAARLLDLSVNDFRWLRAVARRDVEDLRA